MTDPHHKPHVHETPPLHDPVDPWHDHTKDVQPHEPHAEVGNAFAITMIGIGLFLVIVFAVVVTYAFYVAQNTRQLDAMERVMWGDRLAPANQARSARNEALMRLDTYDWVVVPKQGDIPERHYVQRSISWAKDAVIQEYRGR